MYGPQINNLEAEYRRLLPGATLTRKYYVGDNARQIEKDTNGVIIIQYTPWQENRNGNERWAKVMVWIEENEEPAIIKEWRN